MEIIFLINPFIGNRKTTNKEPAYGFFNAREINNKINHLNEEVGKLNLSEFKDIIDNHVANNNKKVSYNPRLARQKKSQNRSLKSKIQA